MHCTLTIYDALAIADAAEISSRTDGRTDGQGDSRGRISVQQEFITKQTDKVSTCICSAIVYRISFKVSDGLILYFLSR